MTKIMEIVMFFNRVSSWFKCGHLSSTSVRLWDWSLVKLFMAALGLWLLSPAQAGLAANQVIVWTGASGQNWNLTDSHWNTVSGGTATLFQDGDIINIDGSSSGVINLNAGDRRAAAVYFWGGSDYTITGGNLIVTNSTGTTFNPSVSTAAVGQLVMGGVAFGDRLTGYIPSSGTLDLAQTTANTFQNGIEINSGTILVNTTDQLGADLNLVTFRAGAASANLSSLKTAIIGGDATAINAAAGSAKTSGNFGAIQIGATGSPVFNGTGAADQHLNVADNRAGSFDLVSGGQLTISNSVYGNNGGAVTVGSGALLALTSSNTTSRYTFSLNQASSAGAVDNNGYLFIQSADFISNSASGWGGAINSSGSALTISDSTFVGNQANFGGALYNNQSGGTTNLTNVAFSSNTSQTSGGALINADGTMNISGGAFIGNTAGAVGGAMVNADVMTITNTNFTGNRSGGDGGAIYNRSTLNLNILAGQTMLFSDNQSHTSTAAVANSIYMFGNNTTASLTIDAAAGSTLDLRDPFSGETQGNGTVTVTKTGAGLWKIGGNSSLTGGAGQTQAFNVNQGTLHLYRAGAVSNGTGTVAAGGISLSSAASSSFNLASGATLDMGGGNYIEAAQVTLAGGSTLGFDLAGINGGQTGLTITSPTQTLSTGANLNFGIDLHSWQAGTFVLVDSQITGKFDLTGLSAAAAGVTINGVLVSTLDRADVTLASAGNGQQLVLTAATTNNVILTWTGDVDANWISGTLNWKDQLTNDAYYLGGDAVIFDSNDTTNRRDINVVGGAAVAYMTVDGGGTYEFSGGSIVSADVSTLTGPDFTKKLTVDNGSTATFKNLVDFQNGLDILNNSIVNLDDGGSFSQRMTIANSGTLNFNKSTAYNQTGALTGTGTFNHTGAGNLTISNGSLAAPTAWLVSKAGSGDLYLNSDWGGSYRQEVGTGVFHAADNVTINGVADFKGPVDVQGATANSAGTLNIGSNLFLNQAALNVDLFSGNSSDLINVTGSVTFSGANAINITTWATGTFDLIRSSNIAGTIPTSADVTVNGHALGSRATAGVSNIGGNTLQLVTTLINADLTWNTDSGQWSYNATNLNWLDNLLSTPDSFHPQDAVFFTGAHNGVVAVDMGGVQVSAMTVNGGVYTFLGGDITGRPVNEPGFVRDGLLNITGPGTQAIFNNRLDFTEGVNVTNSALIGGTGRIKGNLRVASGGIVSPGSSIGTLTVDGDVNFGSDTFFDVEVNPVNQNDSDQLEVTGTAALGGAMVRHIGLGASEDYSPVGQWLILSAGSLNGLFNPAVQTNYQFLTPSLLYQGNDVYLQIRRNGVFFSQFSATRNQSAAAAGLDSLTQGPLYNTLISLPIGTDFSGLYDQLSGEVHASLSGALLNYDRSFGGAMRSRLLSREERPDGYPLWITLDGGRAKTSATGNTAESEFTSYGVSLGAEKRFADSFRAGLALRYGDSELKLDSRHSKADVDSLNLGLYGDWDLLTSGGNALRLSFGGTYGIHWVDSTRRIIEPAVAQHLKADYNVNTAMLFTELGYRFDFGQGVTLEPYGGLAWNSAWTESFRETGGSAALRADSRHNDNFSSTLGLRTLASPSDNLSFKMDINWLHIYGDRDPETTLAFDGGRSFTILGAPLSRDSLGLNLGAEVRVTPAVSIEAGYDGLMGNNYQDHGGRLTLRYDF